MAPSSPLREKVAGTISTTFQIGLTGPLLQANGAALEARTAPNTGFAVVHVASPDYTAPAAITYADFLLSSDLPYGSGYTTGYTGLNLTSETWTNTAIGGTPTVKTIAYTFTGLHLTQEVRKVYATDGTTIIAQCTIDYSYTLNKLSSATYTRNV